MHFAHIMQVNLGMETVEQNGPMIHQGEYFDAGINMGNVWVLWGSTFHQKSGECHDLQRKQIK